MQQFSSLFFSARDLQSQSLITKASILVHKGIEYLLLSFLNQRRKPTVPQAKIPTQCPSQTPQSNSQQPQTKTTCPKLPTLNTTPPPPLLPHPQSNIHTYQTSPRPTTAPLHGASSSPPTSSKPSSGASRSPSASSRTTTPTSPNTPGTGTCPSSGPPPRGSRISARR